MKKFVIFFALIAILATGTAFADHPDGWGVGVIGFYPGGVGLSLKIPNVPVFWGISAGFGTDHIAVHATGDYYIFDNVLVSEANLHWFLGVGGWFSFYSYTGKYQSTSYSWTHLAFGARVPVGLSWQPIPLLELFADIAPSFGVGITGEAKVDGYVAQKADTGFAFYWPIELGIRLWF